MATATPVFEERISTRGEREEQARLRFDDKAIDELHNARISGNLARLLNPENKIKDIVASIDADGTDIVKSVSSTVEEDEYARSVYDSAPGTLQYGETFRAPARTPYLVRNARADADIFRADSPVNSVRNTVMREAPVILNIDEEENEDLRPTPTTIQYQTIGPNGVRVSNSAARIMTDGEIERPGEEHASESRLTLSKRDKVILGVIVGLILSVFVLIIVNSAIISNLNSDITDLENQAADVRAEYEQVMNDISEATSDERVLEAAQEYGFIS